MILGRELGYLFVHVPHTGGSALREELKARYGGEEILYKHASPAEGRAYLGEAEFARLTKFAARRNPLDVLVTRYMRYAVDLHGTYSRGVFSGASVVVPAAQQRAFAYVHRHGATLSQFIAHVPRGAMLPQKFYDGIDVTLRHERLHADLAALFARLGATLDRPVPRCNDTTGKRPWIEYYDGPAQTVARRLLRAEMAFHGYDFPDGWVGARPRSLAGAAFRLRTALAERLPALKRRLHPAGPPPNPELADRVEARVRAMEADADAGPGPEAGPGAGSGVSAGAGAAPEGPPTRVF